MKRKESVTVVIPLSPTPRESFAAEEIKKYLKLILDAAVRVAFDGEEVHGTKILIGAPDRNEKTKELIGVPEFYSEVTGAEGFMLRAIDPDTLIIAGSSRYPGECERGTLYGLYHFLEAYCGCTLAAISHPDCDAGEIVPMQSEIRFEGINYVKAEADRPYRTAIIQYADAAADPEQELNIPFFDWLIKNRYNRILTWTSVYERYKELGLLPEIEKRGLRFTVGHHESSRLFLPAYGNEYFPEHYYETHPEYFKLLEDGTRFINKDPWGQWVFCSRCEGAIETVSKNVTDWLYKNPNVDVLAFWPNDGIYPQCTCEECSKYSKTENYCYFVNEVARRVKKHHPNVMFDMLIYVDLWEAPENIKLEPSVMIDESTWHKDGLRTVGKPDGTSLIGTHFEDNLLKWRKTGANVVYYDYYMGVYSVRQKLIPMADEVQSIWKRFKEKDIMGSGTQIECFNLWNHLLNFYSFGRCGYDTSLSLEDNIASLSKLFGNAGEEVKGIWRMLEDLLDGQVDIEKCGHYVAEHIDKKAVYEAYERAFSLAESKRFRNNLRLLRMVFRYTDLEASEEASKNPNYVSIREGYSDPTGELREMMKYDSFKHNNPGYAIAIPVKSESTVKVSDKWYCFE